MLLTALFITAFALVFSLYGDYSGENSSFLLENGWMMFLYQLPLSNAIFFPMLSIVTASRLADIEHKGLMLKQLSAIENKGKIFDAKLIYGLGIISLCVFINWAAVIIFGKLIGFGGELPLELYLRFLLFTIVPTAIIYIIQHTLSMVFKNQAAAFFSGLIGTFIGLFSMFLPQLPWLRRIIPWGYYGALQFVGLYGWTSETRYQNAYFEIMEIDTIFIIIVIAVLPVVYFAGRKLFRKREV